MIKTIDWCHCVITENSIKISSRDNEATNIYSNEFNPNNLEVVCIQLNMAADVKKQLIKKFTSKSPMELLLLQQI